MNDSSHPPKQLKKHAIRGVVWSFAAKGGTQTTQFLTFLVLARFLSPDAFGLISMANVFIHFVQAIIHTGFSEVIVQRQDIEQEHLDTAFWVNLAIGILVTATGILSASTIATFFQEPTLVPIIQCLSLNILIKSFADIQQATLRRQFNFRGLTTRSILGLVTGSIVGVTMAVLHFGVWSLVAQTLVANTVGTLLLWKMSDWRPGLKFSMPHARELFSFGINFFGISILVFINRRGDDFLIGYFLGPTALGYYTIAYKMFLTIIQILQDATQKVSLPTFSRLQDDPPKMRRAFYTATSLVSLVGIPAFIGLAVISPEFIRVVFGEQWAPSIPVMQILSLNGILIMVMSFSGPIIMALGKPQWSLLLLLLNTIVRIGAFLAVVQYGIVWVAVALVASSYVVWPIYMWVLKRLLSINPLVLAQRLSGTIIATTLMAAAILGLKHLVNIYVSDQVLLTLSIVLGVVVYGGVIALIAPQMIKQVLDLIKVAVPSKSRLKKKGA